MSIIDIFDSGFRKRNQSHFAAIVRIAMSDGVITDEEHAFLDRLAKRLDLSEADYKKILKNYKTHPISPPLFYDKRLERLFDHATMVYADHELGEKQPELLERLAVGLGFNSENAKYIVDKALALVSNGVDLDTFIEEIKNMNR
ncbi:MAG: TerB family tellurite resistance protein [Bacteroidia bacterium]|nr:TerB family tellurite resistance protein [Bacteroidia bacterium]MBT8309223.1 TerB family tellurite resistance protein [Bacteroidia bacterium]NND10741.1 TerB family tellurite resistance protein [Flavobacteriaceae bacterium]NNK27746.1 TerB family tellurite resistance protein [Flavobacteriaceae bacterium]NNL61358.1 TerB family tellurite resistance protein [Flavobacteriaceae bacterium]